ncbi:MAG TPA: pilus assembly protein CpaE [Nocardioides sp.]|nr:pilus assembly protein CpaE [Nocardioides sp.]
MLSLDLAQALRDAGVRWEPQPGDLFVIPDRDLDEQLFVLSDMVVQTLQPPDGPPVLAFNGTTEWALDSLEAGEAVWLPREDQLRELLGSSFERLERVPGPPEAYAVSAGGRRHVDLTTEAAYARAVLASPGVERPNHGT